MAAEQIQDSQANIKVEKQPNGQVRIVIDGLSIAGNMMDVEEGVLQYFGDLPDTMSWLRPFGVTGQVGYQIPTDSFDFNLGVSIPQVLVYGASIQFSMPYLKSEVIDLQLPEFFNHLIPIVEAQFATPVANNFGNPFVTTDTQPDCWPAVSFFRSAAREILFRTGFLSRF